MILPSHIPITLCTLVLIVASGCGIRGLPVSNGTTCPDCETTQCANRETLAVEYLGSGGYVLRRGQDVVLLGPFISNPGALTAIGLKRIEPDVTALERWLPDVSMADAIIVGHAHYDHLLDVPWIAEHRAPAAKVYGSPTVALTLAAVPSLNDRVIPLSSFYDPDPEGGLEDYVGDKIEPTCSTGMDPGRMSVLAANQPFATGC